MGELPGVERWTAPTYPLEPPFMVIATQNPVEMEGTYPLPEAQRDRRFMARIAMGYPGPDAELRMLEGQRRDRIRSTTCNRWPTPRTWSS